MQIINISIINQYKHHCSWLIFDYGWSAPSMIKSFHQIFCDSFDLFGGGGEAREGILTVLICEQIYKTGGGV